MTILNVNDIKEFKEQPIEYNTEKELIDWLKWDLLQQARRNGKEADKNNTITITDEEEKDYILNIGREIWDMEYYINIHFDFSFNNLQVLLYGNSDNIKYNYRINTDYIIFYKEVNFWGALFHKELLFSRIYFYDDVDLSCYFYDKVSFYGITIKKEMYFGTHDKIENVIFCGIIFENQKSMLYIGNINKINNLSIIYTTVSGQLELNNIEIDEADFKGTIINRGYINPVNFKVHKFANRESALFLKQQAYARNNAIDALEYKAKEIEKHKEDLIKDWQKNKDFKTFGDILSIELSSLYSDNGQNWIRALFMTIAITVICFIVFYIPDLTQSNIIRLYYKNLFPELIKYFIPTDYTLLIKYAASNMHLLLKIFGVLVYFLGKVLFWYGSVQTVQAFRKFAKGA